MRTAVLLALAIWGLDMLTKQFLPVLATTSRIPLEGLLAALGIIIIVRGQHTPMATLARAAVVGGAAGNVTDILLYGYIRDVFAIGSLALNLADAAIITGLIIWLTIQMRMVYY